jgi:multidrug efflux system membrane fusion protein
MSHKRRRRTATPTSEALRGDAPGNMGPLARAARQRRPAGSPRAPRPGATATLPPVDVVHLNLGSLDLAPLSRASLDLPPLDLAPQATGPLPVVVLLGKDVSNDILPGGDLGCGVMGGGDRQADALSLSPSVPDAVPAAQDLIDFPPFHAPVVPPPILLPLVLSRPDAPPLDLAPHAVDAIAPDAIAPDAIAPDAIAPDAIAPDPIAPDPIDLEPVDLEPIDLEPVDLEPVDPEAVDLEPIDLGPRALGPIVAETSAGPSEALTRDRPRRSRGIARRGGIVLLFAIIIGAIVWAIWFWPARKPAATATGVDEAVPVVVAAAQRADVPVTMDGLGTVQAYNAITLHVMVDGPLTEVRFKEGQDVHRGDVLARIDRRSYQAALDQAVAKKAQDEAQLANARVDLARYQKLVANNYTSAQTADTQKATVAQLEAQVRQDQAQIDTARTNLSYTDIVAPIDGRVGIRNVDQGNLVHTTDSQGLTTLTQLKPISVVFTLPQQALGAVQAAMAAGEATVEARGQDASGNAAVVLDRGTLAALDNQVDTNTGTIRLKATFPNEKLALWPGAFVNVRLRVATDQGVITVPPSAVQRGPRGAYLFVLNADGTVARRDVTVAHEDERVAVIAGGIAPGARVVTEGTARLANGSKVTVSEPAAAQPANATPANDSPANTPSASSAPAAQ